ncbi:hypothetical protein CVT24_003849 [Panaeolus cyanescens]|uniref:Ubiquitin 3 binding protein But2 C-terminal domain-containing protein n=1 Tax=Panaeolus cyanescens TaxID=181874 RepID=A0A409WND9_9AGAR|nr:hypothetical protein CVT24_003849 [Panaeolus cyanescens]
MPLLNVLSLLTLCLAPISSLGAVVTLYSVVVPEPTPPPTIPLASIHLDVNDHFSAINPSPGSDVTTYAVEEVMSNGYYVDLVATSTYTMLATPTTVTFTRVEGAATAEVIKKNIAPAPTELPNGVIMFLSPDGTLECTYDSVNKVGDCVQEFELPFPTTTITVTNEYTGPLVPIATVTN